jgi:hypothetical protein
MRFADIHELLSDDTPAAERFGPLKAIHRYDCLNSRLAKRNY